MEKNICIFVVVCIVALCSACKDNATFQKETKKQNVQQVDFFRVSPDSINMLTEEQQVLLRKLQSVIVDYIVFVDEKMELRLDEEDFEKLGIPVSYYQKIKQELDVNNQWFQQYPDVNWEESFNLLKEQLKRDLEKQN